MTAASAVSVLWALSAVIVLVFTYADLSGQPVSGSEAFARELAYFVTDLVVGHLRVALQAYGRLYDLTAGMISEP